MDFEKLSLSDKLVLGGALLLTIAMFLPWFKLDFGGFGGSVSANGFDVGFLWATLPWLLSLVMAGHVLMTQLKPDQELPELPIPWGQAHLIAGGIAAAFIVLKLAIGEEFFDRSFGIILAAVAGGALAYAGFLKNGEGDGASASAGSSAPPAPPSEF